MSCVKSNHIDEFPVVIDVSTEILAVTARTTRLASYFSEYINTITPRRHVLLSECLSTYDQSITRKHNLCASYSLK